VLTPAERALLAVLRDAVIGLAEELGRPEPLLLAKVRLADLVEVDAAKVGGDRSRRATAQNRINGKHADFVLCHPETTRPLLVIELDDRSHARDDRKARDAFVDAACAAASLPVLHVPAPPPAARYEPRDLARRIAERLGLATTTSGAPLPSPGGRA
jgi:very-short-patch-repair endonuclease